MGGPMRSHIGREWVGFGRVAIGMSLSLFLISSAVPFSTLAEESDLNLADVRAATAALFPDHQHELQMRFSDEILAGLHTINRGRDASYFRPILRGLVSPLCTRPYLNRLNEAIDAGDDLHPTLKRGLLETRFAATRCIAIGERLASD